MISPVALTMIHADRFAAKGCSLSRHSPYAPSLSCGLLRADSRSPPVILAAHDSLLSRKKTACLFGQAVVSAIHCFQSVHSTMHTGAPGPRRPLDPALERHVLLMLSDFSSEGI